MIKEAEFSKSSANMSQCPEGKKAEFAFIGRSNVGKSSLINMLVNRKGLAKTSGTPGKTQLINHFLIDKKWFIVDLPGYGYARVSKTKLQDFDAMISEYLKKRRQLVNVFSLIDSRLEPQKIDLEFIQWLGEHGIPFSIVFTKTDKLKTHELNRNLTIYKNKLLETWEALPPIFVTSSDTRAGKEEMLKYISQLLEEVI